MPKKVTLCLTLLFVFSFAVPVSAANTAGNQGGGANQGQSSPMNQSTVQTTTAVPPTGMQVKNQNQVQTQNAGEEQSLQVQTKEEETATSSVGNTRIQMDDTTKTMEAVLAVPMIPGGPGAKVQDVLKSQVASQKDIETQIGKLDGRKGVVKMLLGADATALQTLQKQMEQNRLRIQELTQLKAQIANAGDIAMVEETIQMLTEQNTALEEKVTAESDSRGIVGWILQLFAR